MEQLRVALAWIVKYHFWLLSALVVLIAVGVWYQGAGHLAEEYKKSKGEIKSAIDSTKSIQSREFLPNPEVNKQQEQQIEQLTADVKSLWRQLYERQRKEVLKWPPQLIDSFRRQIERLQFGDEIGLDQRAHYTQYISGRFDDLPKIIDANELDESRAGGGGGGFRGGGGEFGGGGFGGGPAELVDDQGNPIEVDYLVYWNDQDQARIKDDLTWQEVASHWKIWTTQEDLWVYETLLRAIAATNEAKGADRRSNAAITDVHALEVGQIAAKEARGKGRIQRTEGGNSLSEFGGGEGAIRMEQDGDPMSEFGGRGEFDGGLGGGDGGGGAAEEKAKLLSGRYINGAGQPIAVPPDEEPLAPGVFGKEIKRLPVRLALQMDSRWIPMLVTQLANADLQIKVTEVRLNPSEAEIGGGRGGGGLGRRGGGGEFGGGGFGFGGGLANQDIRVFDPAPHMKLVIIQGVVLIFNEPSDEALTPGGASGEEDYNTAMN